MNDYIRSDRCKRLVETVMRRDGISRLAVLTVNHGGYDITADVTNIIKGKCVYFNATEFLKPFKNKQISDFTRTVKYKELAMVVENGLKTRSEKSPNGIVYSVQGGVPSGQGTLKRGTPTSGGVQKMVYIPQCDIIRLVMKWSTVSDGARLSLRIATDMGMVHKNVLSKIDEIISNIGRLDFQPSTFFIKSEYNVSLYSE